MALWRCGSGQGGAAAQRVGESWARFQSRNGNAPVSVPQAGDNYYAPNTLNSAKLESGLDNSPMWDGTEFNSSTHQMQLREPGLTQL